MAPLWNFLMILSLLVLSTPQRCSGVDHGSLEHQDFKLLATVQVVNDALKCISDTVQEGLLLQVKNNAEMVLMVKEQMNLQNENIEAVKTQLTALQRNEALSQENTELKKQLENKDEMNEALSQENAELKKQLENRDEKVKAITEKIEGTKQQIQENQERVRHLEETVAEYQQLVSNQTHTMELLGDKVQVLDKKIMEHMEIEEQLEEILMQLNNTVTAQKNNTGSALERQPNRQDIKQLVQQYNYNKDWKILRIGLETVLDRSSEPYSQLQHLEYSSFSPLWYIGLYGNTQLASLLLDVGLPADTIDAFGTTMLHGAAYNGQLQLVKLLLERGASVGVRNMNAETPLILAAHGGHLEVAQLLVSAGADTAATDTSRRTALDHARGQSRTSVVQYLQQLPR